MSSLQQFVLTYGYAVIFVAAFGEQLGVPFPCVPLLIGLGALSHSGEFSFPAVIATAVIAALTADLISFHLGRRHGRSVLRLICRVALEPDNCVRRTEDAFERLGLRLFLVAKFIPGLNAATVPMAGMTRTPLLRFLAVDVPGIVLWSASYTTLGYVFSEEVEGVIARISRMGSSLFILVVASLAGYIVYKLYNRRRFRRLVEAIRITPEDLKAKMDANEKVVILDTRNRLDRGMDPVRIPGAFHVLPEHIEFQAGDIAPDQDVVIYCSCPNEATSGRVAQQLHKMGLPRARPLYGGLDRWREQGLPVETLD